MASEINLDSLWQIPGQISWHFPRVVEMNRQQQLFFYSMAAGFEVGFQGILEPQLKEQYRIQPNELVGILVPGLGFDRKGNRLGKGKGHYDRAMVGFMGIKLGITFEELIVESLPTEEWDIPMDYLVTEKGVLKVE